MLKLEKEPIQLDEFQLRSKKEISGTNYMEFHVGSFDETISHWNENSVYLHHRVYKPLHVHFKKALPSYDDYNNNEFTLNYIGAFKEQLIAIRLAVQNKDNPLFKKFEYPANILEEKYLKILDDLLKFIEKNISQEKSLWVLGI